MFPEHRNPSEQTFATIRAALSKRARWGENSGGEQEWAGLAGWGRGRETESPELNEQINGEIKPR